MSFSNRFGRLAGLTGDTQGRLYVADAFQGEIQVFDQAGVLLNRIGSFGDGPGELRTPMGLTLDPYNRLLVASTNNARLELFGLDSFADPHTLQADVDIKGDTLMRSKKTSALTVYLEIPGAPLEQVRLASITANGVPSGPTPVALGDYDGDGLPDLTVMFDAQRLLAVLPDGKAEIRIAGELLDGTPFEGADTVAIIEPPVIPAIVDVKPDTIRRSSDLKVITAYIELPGAPLEQVDVATVTANGVPANPGPVALGDYDSDGVPDLMVTFDAAAVLATLPDGEAAVMVSGELMEGTILKGSDTVRVRQGGGGAK
jgi:hypothetical protein